MRSAERCSVNIVTWNDERHLLPLFQSLDDQDTSTFTVTVVDNGSDDGTIEWLKQNRPDVTLLRNFRNQGFAKAHNQGIALALSRWSYENLATRYVLIANPDMEFDSSAIRNLIVFMDAHPDVAAAAPKLLRMGLQQDPDDPFSRERTSIIDAMGLAIRKSRRVFDRAAGEEDTGQYDEPHEVFGLSGACLMVRASVLHELAQAGGVFDEDFFLYKEDVDLAWRLRNLGYTSYVVPSAVVWHERGAKMDSTRPGPLTSFIRRRSKSPIVNHYSTRNHAWVVIKNDLWGNTLRHAPWIVTYEVAKIVASFLSASSLKSEWTSLMGYPKMFRKRRELRALHRTSAEDIRKWFV